MKKKKEITRDKLMTENFLQDFAIYSSHIVIAVVGQLTFQDQKFLNRMKDICKNKKLLIIHNLFFESKEQVENYIKNTIRASLFFKLEKQSMINFGKREKDKNKNKEEEEEKDKKMDYLFIEEIDDYRKKYYIIHLIMAKEGTEAGNYYNKTTINFLRDNIFCVTKLQKYDVIEEFKKFLCINFNKYFEVPYNSYNQLERGQII